MKYGALEAGGTKMVVAVADEGLHILARESIPTLTPAETMPRILDFFRTHQPDALGVGSFGPLDLHPASPTYGYITKTPKLAWCDYPLLPEMQKALGVPCALDTDVNAAALCEAELGAARGVSIAACAEYTDQLYEYTPMQVKQAIVGWGGAEKKQIQQMVKMLLHMEEIAKPDDAADAIAIALTHAAAGMARGQFRMT